MSVSMSDALQTVRVAVEALEVAEGNINPERGFCLEAEEEIIAALAQCRDFLARAGSAKS